MLSGALERLYLFLAIACGRKKPRALCSKLVIMAGRKPVDTGSEIQVSFSDIEQQYGQSGKEFEENALQSILQQHDAKWQKQFDKLANELKRQRTYPTDLNTDSRVEGEKGIGTLTAQADASKLDAEAKGKAVNIGASTSRKNDTDVEEEDVDGVFSSYP